MRAWGPQRHPGSWRRWAEKLSSRLFPVFEQSDECQIHNNKAVYHGYGGPECQQASSGEQQHEPNHGGYSNAYEGHFDTVKRCNKRKSRTQEDGNGNLPHRERPRRTCIHQEHSNERACLEYPKRRQGVEHGEHEVRKRNPIANERYSHILTKRQRKLAQEG